MNIILLAPPAAGKGTQAQFLVSKYHMKHISTGELLRKSLKQDDEISKEIKERMNAGRLVSDEIILDLIAKEIETAKEGVVLDGFPRNRVQAIEYEQLLQKLGQKLDVVLYLSISKEVAKKRMKGRRTCPTCGKIYNMHMEEMLEELCGSCHTSLVSREDDNEETFDLRYETYMRETDPLISFYQEKGLLKQIDASKEKEEVFKKIEQILSTLS
jgi:adenylate kinase